MAIAPVATASATSGLKFWMPGSVGTAMIVLGPQLFAISQLRRVRSSNFRPLQNRTDIIATLTDAFVPSRRALVVAATNDIVYGPVRTTARTWSASAVVDLNQRRLAGQRYGVGTADQRCVGVRVMRKSGGVVKCQGVASARAGRDFDHRKHFRRVRASGRVHLEDVPVDRLATDAGV